MTEPQTPDLRKTLIATGIAALVALVVLVAAVLPAEYGIDPTGLGRAVGFSRLSDPPSGPSVEPGDPNRTTYLWQAEFRVYEHLVLNESTRLHPHDTTYQGGFTVTTPNVTKVRAEVRWSDGPEAGPQRVDLQLLGPRGLDSQLVLGSPGPEGFSVLETEVVVSSVPAPEHHGDHVRVPTGADDTTGSGDWTARVRLVGGGSDPDGTPITLRVWVEHHALDVVEQEGPADQVRLTLGPRGAVEYKFAMDANATMTYRWTSTQAVYFDLHGDQHTEASVVSFDSGTQDHDQGTFVAPFSGRHGWFFRNPNPEPTTIVLETTGDYTILGVT